MPRLVKEHQWKLTSLNLSLFNNSKQNSLSQNNFNKDEINICELKDCEKIEDNENDIRLFEILLKIFLKNEDYFNILNRLLVSIY